MKRNAPRGKLRGRVRILFVPCGYATGLVFHRVARHGKIHGVCINVGYKIANAAPATYRRLHKYEYDRWDAAWGVCEPRRLRLQGGSESFTTSASDGLFVQHTFPTSADCKKSRESRWKLLEEALK